MIAGGGKLQPMPESHETLDAKTPSDGAPAGGTPPLVRAIGPKLLIFFIIGDILGTGIYATTGKVAGKVGGALWLPFVIGFAVALLTAASYAELVGKYPRAAGAALYVKETGNGTTGWQAK